MLASESIRTKPSLKDDQNGAAMIIGLFMALSLVGSLWYVIGIGQAIVFRDRGQEAADAMAMSVAAVDARGMDLIALINIVSLCLVGIYLVVQIVADAMMVSGFFYPEGQALDRANTSIMQNGVLSVALPVLGAGSAAVAVLTPWMGTTIIAPEVASHYEGFEKSGPFPAFGLSNLPGAGLSTAQAVKENSATKKKNGANHTKADKMTAVNNVAETIRLGLPVAFEPNKTLCVRAISKVTDLIEDLFNPPTVVVWAIDIVIGLVADAYAEMRCSKKPFPWPGPKKMAGDNGGAASQVYGFATGQFKDKSDRKVRLGATRPLWGGAAPADQEQVYNAQAEFFFDCEGEWGDNDCNGGSIGMSDVTREHAVYSLHWRARLVKYTPPVEMVVGHLIDSAQSAVVDMAFKGLETAMSGIAGNTAGGAASNMARDAFDNSDFGKNQVPKPANALKEKAEDLFGSPDNYH